VGVVSSLRTLDRRLFSLAHAAARRSISHLKTPCEQTIEQHCAPIQLLLLFAVMVTFANATNQPAPFSRGSRHSHKIRRIPYSHVAIAYV